MASPDQEEQPLVTTEPQRRALDEMSRELLDKLNSMVAAQNARAEEFARTQHSLSARPMVFNLPGTAPHCTPTTTGHSTTHPATPLPAAPTTSGEHAPAPPLQQTRPPLPSLQQTRPPLPPLPPQQQNTPMTADQRSELMRRQREQRRAAQLEEEQRLERIRQAQEEASSTASLLEFLGLKKKAAPADNPTTSNPQPASPPQSANTPSIGCGTLLTVAIIIYLILWLFT